MPSKNLIKARDLPEWLESQGYEAVHRNTVFRWCTVGVRGRILKSHHVGGCRYVYERDVNEFLKT